MKQLFITIIFVFVLYTLYPIPYTLYPSAVVFAQSVDTPCDSTKALCNPLGTTETVSDLIRKIVNWLTVIGGPIAVGFIIWGALQMVFATGDPEKFKAGRQTIFYTVIGYAIILIGWGIAKIIENVLKG